MKHLFIINSQATLFKRGGRLRELVRDIRAFFANYPQIKYDIHITRWKRDATGYSRRYVAGSDELVRVYAMGGTSTLFEVVNGVIGLPNVQVGMYPAGRINSSLQYFGQDKSYLFRSLQNLIYSGVVSMDALRCGNNYGMSLSAIGLEAMASRAGDAFINQAGLWPWRQLFVRQIYFFTAVYYALKKGSAQYYRVAIDGEAFDGEYLSVLMANQPHHRPKPPSEPDARPDDGILDIYLVRPVSKLRALRVASDYVQGQYGKWPQFISHHRGKGISISCDQFMSISLDGEPFFSTDIDCAVVPHAIDFVCPGSLDPRYTAVSAKQGEK
ncbi:MAG: hypothetical protein LBQ57_12125 [Spirochaetales bacterium]|jgi:diacylglycerol kinase family enzyme|nr:hypothetical protein [Spirochaetales bacterium]